MKKMIAGPMATLSHQGLRKIISDFGGCDEYYTEMINAASYLTHGQFEKFYVLNEFVPDKIVWQITGKDAHSMAQCAKELCAKGGIGIDLNMGCSAPEIIKSGAGIAWMLKPIEETKALVCEVRNTLDSFNLENFGFNKNHKKLRLSVKLRLGDEDFTDDGFYKFCDMLFENGVEQIVLHPRTKKEKLARQPRYHYVEELSKRYLNKIPIILNGNIKDRNSLNDAIKKAPNAKGIMIARMSAQKPWIFRELSTFVNQDCDIFLPEKSKLGIWEPLSDSQNLKSEENILGKYCHIKIDRLACAIEYINDIRMYQPKEFFETRMKRFFSYYCDNFSFAHYVKSKMLNCKTLEDAEKAIESYFNEIPSDRFLII